jgi:hypothetical protein
MSPFQAYKKFCQGRNSRNNVFDNNMFDDDDDDDDDNNDEADGSRKCRGRCAIRRRRSTTCFAQ